MRDPRVDKGFDGVTRELADRRERLAMLEGSLEGFPASGRDRDAARAPGYPRHTRRAIPATRAGTSGGSSG